MIFTIEQLERFKVYAHRTMVRLEEWKNNRDVQVGVVAEEIQGGFSEGYHTAMHEVRSTPWEYVCHPVLTDAAKNDSIMNYMAADGWELQHFASGWHVWRRRKAIADIAAQEKSQY